MTLRPVHRHPRRRLLGVALTLLRLYARNWSIRPFKRVLPRERYWELKKAGARKNAALLYRNILDYKGLFIKVGQFLSLRVDLLPRAYTRELAKLQDQVPPADFHLIRDRIEDELGKPIGELFATFNTKPIAAASLGQVHEATLNDGRRVAVKVQYPGIEETVRTDLEILRLVFKWYGLFRSEFQSAIVLDEFRHHVDMELDYIQEGKNAERMAKNFERDERIVIPKIVWSHTTRKVLVLEFIEGIKVTERERLEAEGYKMADISKLLLDCYFRQIFRDGFFHADAHPGNLFILPGPIGPNPSSPPQPKLAVLDFGLSKQLDPGFLPNLVGMAQAMFAKDVERTATHFRDLGLRVLNQEDDTFVEFSRFMIRNMDDVIYKNPKKINYPALLNQVLEMIRTHPVVAIPGDFVLLARILGQLSGIGRQLGVTVSLDDVLLPHLGPSPS